VGSGTFRSAATWAATAVSMLESTPPESNTPTDPVVSTMRCTARTMGREWLQEPSRAAVRDGLYRSIAPRTLPGFWGLRPNHIRGSKRIRVGMVQGRLAAAYRRL